MNNTKFHVITKNLKLFLWISSIDIVADAWMSNSLPPPSPTLYPLPHKHMSFSLWEFSCNCSFVSREAWPTSVEWHPGPVEEGAGRQWEVNITNVFKYENCSSQHISAELRSFTIAMTPTSIQPSLTFPRSCLMCLIPHVCLLASSTN